MKDRTFLQKRKNGYYYFRKRLSPEIQNIVGKTEIIKSLNTTDKNEAIKLSSKLETRFYEFFHRLYMGDFDDFGILDIFNKEDLLEKCLKLWLKSKTPEAFFSLLEQEYAN
jgi:hypothetical protein